MAWWSAAARPVPTEAEVGQGMTVEASYTDGHGTDEVVSSGATAAVANVNDAPTARSPSTTPPQPGRHAHCGQHPADADGLGTITYTWKADGVVVGSGATLSRPKPRSARR